MRDFGSALVEASSVPSISRVAPGRIVRYASAHEAVVLGAKTMQAVYSTLPLAAEAGGRERPLDLHLNSSASGYAPANPAHRILIGRDLAHGVDLDTSGLRVTMAGRDAAGASLAGKAVFFPGIGQDVDATVAPTPSGVELFASLRSRLSPQVLRYHFSLPSGESLRAAGGGAEVIRANHAVADIPMPSAVDAQGEPVSVTTEVAGGELVLHVPHRQAEVAYPIMVDPEISLEEGAPNWTFEQGRLSSGWPNDGAMEQEPGDYVATRPGAIEAPRREDYSAAPDARWVWRNPSREVPTSVGVYFNQEFAPDRRGGGGEFVATMSAGCGSGGVPLEYFESEFYLNPVEPYESCDPTAHNDVVLLLTRAARGPEPAAESDNVAIGELLVTEPIPGSHGSKEEQYGAENEAERESNRVNCGKFPVNCAIGNQFETQTDLTVGGRGLGLNLTRSYNSQLAAEQSSPGPFGYGWTGPYSAHLEDSRPCSGDSDGERCTGTTTVYQDNGSVVQFEAAPNGRYHPLSLSAQATLSYEDGTYSYTLPDQTVLAFNRAGALTSETDRNGNTTTMNRDSEAGRLESVTDPAGRKLTFAYSTDEQVASATDPDGHTVRYSYDDGNLASVTEPGETTPRWRFVYDSSHELTEETDGLDHTVVTQYDNSSRVISQTDALGRKTTWEYPEEKEIPVGKSSDAVFRTGSSDLSDSTESSEPVETETIVTEPNGAKNQDRFNSAGEPTSIKQAAGTSLAATTRYYYDASGNPVTVTDPDGHTTYYTYGTGDDRTSETDALGHTTEWTYNGTHDVLTITTPNGETTTVTRAPNGDAESVSRPTPGGTQTTTYAYDSHGSVTNVTDPLGHTQKFTYDNQGDRVSETDAEGDTRTFAYNPDSQQIATTSPRGNVPGGNPARYTTTIERDAQGRVVRVIEPLE